MGIFGNLFKGRNDQEQVASNVPTASTPVDTGSSEGLLNLTKGGILDLNKYSTSLSKVRAAAGWQVNRSVGSDYDLDLCAYLMTKGRVSRVVYYGKKDGPGLFLDGDNLTGSTGQNDDENIYVTLSGIPSDVDKIVFAVVIYEAASRGQKFKNVKNAYMRLVDEANGKEICRYVLTDDGGDNTAATLASLSRTGSGWQFEAIGKYSKDTIFSLRDKLN